MTRQRTLIATRPSDHLFGRSCRLPIAAWIVQHDKRFFKSQPPTFGTTTKSNIGEELERFALAGMLSREQHAEGATIWFERTDSALWEIVEVAIRVTGIRWDGNNLIG